MEKKSKSKTYMLYVGIALIIIAAILMVGNFMSENTYPILLAGMGLVFLISSRFGSS